MRAIALLLLSCGLGCEATMPPPPRAVPEPPPSGKAQLDDKDLDRGIEPLREALGLCIDWYAGGKPEAILEIDPSGRVTAASVHRIINVTEKRCIERDLKMAHFPAFTGPAMRVVRMIEGPPVLDGGEKG